ncbi:MAG TPA: AMP-binding protein [Acidobacteriota bacterium]|nr:AMP-binding protein [Acidobacteriota bacterium]
MDKIWRCHWPVGVEESSIQLPDKPLTSYLKSQAHRVPDRPAIIFYGRAVSFSELDAATDRMAGWFRSRGLQHGDRVAIFMENCPQFAIVYFGALKAGGINVCLNPMHKAVELQHEFEDSGARFLATSDLNYPIVEPIRSKTRLESVLATAYSEYIPTDPALPVPPAFFQPARRFTGTEDLAAAIEEASPLEKPEIWEMRDTALLQYTSGTTGTPKGAELTMGNVTANCELTRLFFNVADQDVQLSVLPWFHITGMECQMNLMAYCGATLVTLGRFDIETALSAVQKYRCTLTTLIATINVALVNSPKVHEYDLSSLRGCFSGGAPVPPEVARRWEQVTGHKLVEGYGLSETTAPTHINPPQRPKYGTVGVPLPYVEAKVVSLDDEVSDLGTAKSGEIVVRGPMVMKGYWRNPEASAQYLREGWFYTGDIGRVDEEGYFTIEERKKDMLKASGYSVFPAEVEAIMYRHPAIAEVGVVGVPDPYRGEDIFAFIVLKSGAKGTVSEEQVIEWCRGEMAVYKSPRRVRFVDALPKTASGKILKRLLREQARV